ncbi:MAG: hypothetical protein ABSD88_08315 [Candidatus Korobacteraceae bacterium]|jgi:hypothetical protein
MPDHDQSQSKICTGREPLAEDFRQALLGFLFEAEKDGRSHVDVSAAQLHRALGGYPGEKHRIPICCSVMRTSMRQGDSIVQSPPSGTGPGLTIRFVLPRPG